LLVLKVVVFIADNLTNLPQDNTFDGMIFCHPSFHWKGISIGWGGRLLGVVLGHGDDTGGL
jgi:hypothetical protein